VRTFGIIALILILLMMGGYFFIKSNSLTSLAIREGYRQITNITVVDKRELSEIKTENRNLNRENRQLTRLYTDLDKDNINLYKQLGEQNKVNKQLEINLAKYRKENEFLINYITVLSPTEKLALLDSLSGGDKYLPSTLIEKHNLLLAEIDINRIEEIYNKIMEGIYYKGENQIISNQNQESQNTIKYLTSLNANLNDMLSKQLQNNINTIQQRDNYKKLLDDISSNVNRNLFIAWSIIAIETALIILILL